MFKKYRPTLVRMLTLAIIFSLLGNITGTTTIPAQAQPADNIPSSITLPTDRINVISKDFYGEVGYSAPLINPSISPNGRYIVYQSDYYNGIPSDIFIHDRITQFTYKMPFNHENLLQPAYPSSAVAPSISNDGRYIVFTSLEWGEYSFPSPFVRIYDRLNPNSEPDYISGGGSLTDCAAISGDGRYVAFETPQPLASNDNNEWLDDIYVKEISSGDYTLVSVSSNGVVGNEGSGEGRSQGSFNCSPSISEDGRYIAFTSPSSNLVDGDTNGKRDIFVRDQILGTTIRASVGSNGVQGSQDSINPSISPDGRYVTFSTASALDPEDTNEAKDIYMHNLETGETSWVSQSYPGASFTLESSEQPSISNNGRYVAFRASAHDNEGSFWGTFINDTILKSTILVSSENLTTLVPDGISLSASGQEVTFDSSNNLVSEDTNNTTDVFWYDNARTPIILVHGFQGFSEEGGYHCSGIGKNDIKLYNPDLDNTDSTLHSTDGSPALADWLVDDMGYEVWIAHLETTPLDLGTLSGGTPSLYLNAKCLRNQIEYVATQNPQPITIIAHSMGGVVSRAAIRDLEPEVKVGALFTLGSPHAGIPIDSIVTNPPFSNICISHVAICEMAYSKMFNYNHVNKNLSYIDYYFIGGNGGTGFISKILQAAGGGETNDGLVGQESAVGWAYSIGGFTSNWADASIPFQYYTDETHPARSTPEKAYYVGQNDPGNTIGGIKYSDSYLCIKALWQGQTLSSNNCSPATPQQPLEANSQQEYSFTDIDTGSLAANEVTSVQISSDTANPILFYVNWNGGNAPSVTLTRPDGQVIDPTYAEAHPAEVTYETGTGAENPEAAPYIGYYLTSGQIGSWIINITATDAIEYQAFGMLESSNIILNAQTDNDSYQINQVATITATLNNNGAGLPGATVIASLDRMDGIQDAVSLSDPDNDGIYTGAYEIPNAPGYLTIDVTATGTNNGIIFTRQKNLIVTIAPDNLTFTGNYADAPNDENADSFYEYLDFSMEVNANVAKEYSISAELYAGNQLITQSSGFYTLTGGIQDVTLKFDGNSIREKGLDGPYIIKNLYVTPLDVGVPDLSVENIWTTSYYDHSQFGTHPCYTLTLTHSGSGDDPIANPANSEHCGPGEYAPNEDIVLTASPSNGWHISGWTGAIYGNSTANSNALLMPGHNHTVEVHYGSETWNTFLGGIGTEFTSSVLVSDTNGNSYIAGRSNFTWGNPIRPHSACETPSATCEDIYVAKVGPDGSLIWNTFLGGSESDTAVDIAIDNTGNIYVSGFSYASWGTPLRAFSGNLDGVVAKLNSSGTLIWNTFLGGGEYDTAWGIEVDSNQNIYINGYSTASWGTPIHAFTSNSISGTNDIFVAKINPSGTLAWNTFLGGVEDDRGYGITLDNNQNILITGHSDATWGTPVRAFVGGVGSPRDAFVAKLNSAGALTWNTFLGGNGMDRCINLAADASGNIYVVGYSTEDWGTPIYAYSGGSQDGIAVKLSPTGTLVWNTFYGGGGKANGYNVTLDGDGNVNIVGGSNATWGYPIHGYTANFDALVVKMSPYGGLLANTFLGGNGEDRAYGIYISADGRYYISGMSKATWGTPIRAYTESPTYPEDTFVLKTNLDSAPLIVSSIIRNNNSPTNATSVSFEVKFSENVTGIDVTGPIYDDFALTTDGVTGATITNVSGSGSTYTVTVNTGTGYGTLRLDVTTNGHIVDIDSNPLAGSFDHGQAYTIDRIAPTVSSITRASVNPTNSVSVDYIVTFSEAVTGVGSNDFSLTISGLSGTSITSVSGSGNSYTVTVNTGSGSGTLNLIVPATATIYDSVGNALSSLPFTTGQVYNVRTSTFSDVPVSYWAWQYIERAYSAGVTGGCSTNPLMYCPETNVTRDIMAIFLLRGKYGSTYAPPPVGSSTGFNDVPTTYWAAAWIKELAAEGITSGCGNGNYCPGTVVTREQMAVFLLRAKHGAAYTPPAATGMFADVPQNYSVAAWIEQLVNEGISGGCSTTNPPMYCPSASVTRAQMAIFLVRTFNLP